MASFLQSLAVADVAQQFEHGALGRGHQEVSAAARQGRQAYGCRQRVIEQVVGLVSGEEDFREPVRQRGGHISPGHQPLLEGQVMTCHKAQKRRSPHGAGFVSACQHSYFLVAGARFELATFGL